LATERARQFSGAGGRLAVAGVAISIYH
jgi:hypothetical protein